MRSILSLAVVVCCLTPAGLAQTAAVNLRPKWEAGQTSRYHFTTTRVQDTTLSAAGRTRRVATTVESEGEVTWRVDRVNADGSYDCSMTLDWMTAGLTGPDGKTQENDSRRASGDTPPIHDLLEAMTGVTLSVSVAPDGRITGVDGVDQMRRDASNPDMVPQDLDFIESATDLATLAGAPAQLAIGGTWDAQFKWTHDLGFIHQEVTYRLTGVEPIAGIPVAMVIGTGSGRLEVDRSQMPKDGPPIDIRLTSSEHQTQVMFDLVRHEAVGRNTVDSRVIDITIRLPTPPGPVTRHVEETISSQTLRVAEQ